MSTTPGSPRRFPQAAHCRARNLATSDARRGGRAGQPVSEPKARVRLTSGVDALLRPARRTGMTDGHLWSPGAVAIRVVVISGRVRAAGDPGCHIAE